MRLLGFGKGIALCNFIAVQQFALARMCCSTSTGLSHQRQSFFPRRGVWIVAHQSPELQHRFLTKTALEDALLPREIVALTTLPQSGFVQQPITFTFLCCRLQFSV